jgi:hypothetical protein
MGLFHLGFFSCFPHLLDPHSAVFYTDSRVTLCALLPVQSPPNGSSSSRSEAGKLGKMLGEFEMSDLDISSIQGEDYLGGKKPGSDRRIVATLTNSQLAHLEHLAIKKLATVIAHHGLDFADSVNIWISLKSKSGLIFCGSSLTGLGNLVDSISTAFVEKESNQVEKFLGHPWWASKSQRPSTYITAQQRFTSIRFRSFLDEVGSSGKTEKLYFALLKGISRLELREFFVDIQRQASTFGGILELPLDMASVPTTIPKNLLLLATIKLEGTMIVDWDVLNNSTAIYVDRKHAVVPPMPEISGLAHQSMQTVLIKRWNISLADALSIIKQVNQAQNLIKPLFQFFSLVRKYNPEPQNGLVRDAILYLGNAWDVNGRGLFDERPMVNVQHAIDFWLFQSAIPRLMSVIRKEPEMRADVIRFLDRSFPLTARRVMQATDIG